MSDLLTEQQPAFDEVDPFLHLVLGIVSTARRTDRVAAEVARTPPAAPEDAGVDNPLRDALLGLIALRRRWTDVEASLVAEARPAPEPPPVEPPPDDLLR